MNKLITILLFLPSFCHAQLSPEEQATVDSLERAIEKSANDTLRVKTILLLDDIICTVDPERDLELNRKVDRISQQNLSKKLSPKEKRVFLRAQAYANNNIGTCYYYNGKLDSAEKYYTVCLAKFDKLNDRLSKATTYNNLSNVLSDKGDYVKAIEYLQESIQIHEQMGVKDGMASPLNNIGIIYSDQKMYRKAIEYFKKSLVIKKELGDRRGEAITYENMALAYKSIADSAKAKGNEKISENYRKKFLSLLEKSLLIHREIGFEQGIASTYLNFAGYHIERNEYTKASEYVEESLLLHEKLDDQSGLTNAYIIKGEIASALGNTREALAYFEKALQLSKETESITDIDKAAEHLWKIYKELGESAKALEMHELHIKMSDTIESESNQKEIFRQEYRYEYEKRAAADSIIAAESKKLDEARMARQDAELEAKNNLQILLFGGLGLVIVFSIFIFNRFRVTQKQKTVIEEQKHIVDEKNKEILDSITYAKRIQEAILPSKKTLQDTLKNGFVLYKPKDIVAGDFYWMERHGRSVYVAAADCTGHGVPGAMVSVVCSNALSKSLLEESITEPGKILDRARELVIEKFSKSGENVRDGMDISLASLTIDEGLQDGEHKESLPYFAPTLTWSGANNPLWIIRNGELIEYKADKQPIGKYEGAKPFTTHAVRIENNDSIYIFTDGFQDQFGGEKGKKYKASNLKALLLSIQHKSMDEQKEMIDAAFEKWKGGLEQNDDVCVIGIRI